VGVGVGVGGAVGWVVRCLEGALRRWGGLGAWAAAQGLMRLRRCRCCGSGPGHLGRGAACLWCLWCLWCRGPGHLLLLGSPIATAAAPQRRCCHAHARALPHPTPRPQRPPSPAPPPPPPHVQVCSCSALRTSWRRRACWSWSPHCRSAAPSSPGSCRCWRAAWRTCSSRWTTGSRWAAPAAHAAAAALAPHIGVGWGGRWAAGGSWAGLDLQGAG
jgi:hypothetical protein